MPRATANGILAISFRVENVCRLSCRGEGILYLEKACRFGPLVIMILFTRLGVGERCHSEGTLAEVTGSEGLYTDRSSGERSGAFSSSSSFSSSYMHIQFENL